MADAEGNIVYLFGGRNEAGALADLWSLNINENTWSALTPNSDAPAARFGHNAAFDPERGILLVFGGQAGADFFSDTWAFEPAANTWTQLSDGAGAPAPRYGAASALDHAAGGFFISHGFTNQGRFDDTWAFDPASNAWTDYSPLAVERPEPRCLVRMAGEGIGQRLYLFGGQSNSAPFLDDFWVFDVAGRTWQQLDIERPTARNLYALAQIADQPRMVLYAGNSADGLKDDIWVFDAGASLWQPVFVEGGGPPPRSSHDMTWLGTTGTGVIFGGLGSEGDLNDLWELSLP